METEAAMVLPRKLWEHPDPKSTAMYAFMQSLNRKYGLNLETFNDLYTFSCENRSQFYAHLFSASNLIHTGTYTRVVDESLPISSVPRWFEGIRCNWAENILYTRSGSDPTSHHGKVGKEDGKIAVTEVREGNSSSRSFSWATLRREAGRLAAAMKKRGVGKGDRVVLVGANSWETLLIFLATTWLGGLFSSSSTDMGVEGILQRTIQINPKFIFFDDAAVYNGKTIDLRAKMSAVCNGMASSAGFEGIVVVPRFSTPADIGSIPRSESWASFLTSAPAGTPPPAFEQCDFSDPFLVYYSSGTTGIPKAIVHAVGPILLNLFKEGRLHEGADATSVAMQYTTTGWIMYLANVGQLLFGARSIMYDGSPFQPDLTTYIRLLGQYKVTKLGTGPRWLFELAKNGIKPKEVTDLSSLRVVTSTGMVLSDQLFEWFYDVGFPKSVQLANVSGGTDIAGCFGIENPLEPVYLGGTQGGSLGVPIAIYDSLLPDGPGTAIPEGEPGELVATAAFPNIPCFMWGDKLPVASPGSKYHSAYFARFNNVWAHGDFCSIHPVTKNLTFYGRADGVLNPSGVRFGSAEIYSVVERNFADAIADSLCVGQRRKADPDERVMLFLLMKPGKKFDRKLVNDVKAAIGRELTKRHVPKFVFQTPDIPTTVNLKKVELPVKRIVSGYTVKPSGTLLNPQSLDFYYQFAKVEELVTREKL